MSRKLDRGEEPMKPVMLPNVNLYTCHFPETITFSALLRKAKNDCLWLRFILKRFIFTCPFCSSLLTLTSTFQLLYCFSESHLSSNQILFCKCFPFLIDFLSFCFIFYEGKRKRSYFSLQVKQNLSVVTVTVFLSRTLSVQAKQLISLLLKM